ncbi:MAG TPA: pitrilysin family protein [Nitrospirota bacterium]|jgi:zinc protease
MKKLLPVIALIVLVISGCATAPVSPMKSELAPRQPLGERYVLDNGMVLLVKENHALPVVMVNMIIKAGSIMEKPEKAGLAHLTAGLMTKGAGGMGANEISEAIEFVGGSLSVGGGTDYASARLTVLRKDADAGFGLLGKALKEPAFEQSEIDRLKKTIKAGIIRGEQDPGTVASKAYAKAVFGEEHPYGRPMVGTVETVDAVTRDDIVGFHDALYAPNNTIIAVVGDITADEAKSLIAKHLSGWEKKDIPAPVFPDTPKASGVKDITVNRDITQANILMGHVGISREDPDYYALYVMNYALGGGGFASRILDKIRDDMGLAYSAYSYFMAQKYDGSFQVGMETKNESARTAIDETLKLIEKMKAEGVTDAELQDAKDYITGSFPRRQDTNSKIADLLAQVEYYNLGLDYFDMYQREIDKVTKDDVIRVARKYLHPDNIYVVVVGDLKKAGME